MGYYVVINDLLDVAHTIEETVSEKWSFQISELMMAMFGYTQCNELAGDSKTEMDNYVCKIQNKYGVDTKQLQSDFVSAVGQYRDMYLSIEPNENGVISQDTLFEQCRYIVQERIELQENYNKLQSALQSIADLYSPSMILNTNGINALFDLMNYKLTSLNEKIQEVENGDIKQRFEGIEQSSVELLSSCKKYQSNEIGALVLEDTITEVSNGNLALDMSVGTVESMFDTMTYGMSDFPIAVWKFNHKESWEWGDFGDIVSGLVKFGGGVGAIYITESKSYKYSELLIGTVKDVKWLGTSIVVGASLIENGFDNYQEYEDSGGTMGRSRAISETAIETGTDLTIAGAVGCVAVAFSAPVSIPSVVVVGAAAYGIDKGLDYASNKLVGKDFHEVVADGYCDAYEYISEDAKAFYEDAKVYFSKDYIQKHAREELAGFVVDKMAESHD